MSFTLCSITALIGSLLVLWLIAPEPCAASDAIHILKNIPIVGPFGSAMAGLTMASLNTLGLRRTDDAGRKTVGKLLDINPSDLNPLHSLGQLSRHLHAAVLNASEGVWIGRRSAVDRFLPHLCFSFLMARSAAYSYAIKINDRLYRCSERAHADVEHKRGMDDAHSYTWYPTGYTLDDDEGARTHDELQTFVETLNDKRKCHTIPVELLAYSLDATLDDANKLITNTLGYAL